MSEPIVRTLASVASPQVCMPYDGVAGAHLFTATVSGAGSVSAAVAVEGSNDLIGWASIVTLSPSGSGSAVASASTGNSYRYVRANVSAVTGQLIVKMASETVEADTAVPPGMKPVYATISGSGMDLRGIAPSGTVAAADGTLTLGTALVATFPTILLYLPAAAVASGVPGFYRVAMSSPTVGVVYDAQTGALVAGTGVAYTGVTAEVVVAQSKVSWGELVSGRPVRLKVQGICNNTAGAKTYRARFGSVSGTQINSAGPTSNKGFAPETCIQSVSAGLILGGASGVTGGTNSAEIISAPDGQDVIVYHTIQLSTATDYAAIVSITQTTE